MSMPSSRRPAVLAAVLVAVLVGTSCRASEGPPGEEAPSRTGESASDTVVPESPSGPADTVPGTVAVHPWTTSEVRADSSTGFPGTIRALRTEGHEEFDRITLEMDGPGLPAFEVGYVDPPIHGCGSGRPVEPPGQAWLRLRMTGTRGHTDRGEATVRPQVRTAELERVLRIDRTCDFEGTVELVLSLDTRAPFRLTEGPGRLVLDVATDSSAPGDGHSGGWSGLSFLAARRPTSDRDRYPSSTSRWIHPSGTPGVSTHIAPNHPPATHFDP